VIPKPPRYLNAIAAIVSVLLALYFIANGAHGAAGAQMVFFVLNTWVVFYG
jgi:hypothetical protein